MFSPGPGPPVSSTNKTDRHDVTEILLKVALNTIKQTNPNYLLALFPNDIWNKFIPVITLSNISVKLSVVSVVIV